MMAIRGPMFIRTVWSEFEFFQKVALILALVALIVAAAALAF